MKSITLKNFKSYQSQTVTEFNPRVNVILGMNGQGKSNLLKAISFLFTDKFTINKNQMLKILYRGAKQNDNEIQVEVLFGQRSSGQTFKIAKNWKNGSIEDLRINEKFKTKNQFQNFIESFGFSYSNPYNIVQQGKVTQIALMDQFQLYKLLQQATGIRKFKKRFQIASADLVRISTQQGEIKQLLDQTKKKLVAVQDKKNEFQYFALQQKTRGIKNKRALINSLQNLRKNLQKSKEQFSKCSKEIDQSRLRIKQRNYQISQLQSQQNVTQDKIKFYESEQSIQESGEDSINSSFINQKQMSKKEAKKALSSKQNQLKQLQKKLQNEHAAMIKYKKQAINLQKNLEAYRQKYEMIKADFQIQNGDKNKAKMNENLSTQIQTDKQNIKNIQSQIQKLDKFIKQLQKPSNIQKDQQELRRITQQCQRLSQIVKQNKIKLIQNGRKKMNLQCQAQTINNRKKFYEDMMRKVLPNLDFNLLNILRKQNVKGVHGYLLEFLNINPDFRFAYELAGLSKLCTLLVDNEEVASNVIEINKKIKGKQINILPISFLSNQAKQKRSYPVNDKVHVLLDKDWISVNQSLNLNKELSEAINKIITNTFSKFMLVQDYSTGLKVSKEYHLNCITAQSQIIYAEAFLCKVGRQESYQKSRIQIFQIYQSFLKQQSSFSKQLLEIQKIMNQLHNQQISLFGKYNQCQMKKKHINQKLSESKTVQRTLDRISSQKQKLIGVISRLEQSIQQKLNSIQKLKSNSKIKFSPQELKSAESNYFTYKKNMDSHLQQAYQKQKQVSSIQQKAQQLKQQIQQLQKKVSGQANHANLLGQKLQDKDKLIHQLKKQCRMIHDRLSTYHGEIEVIQNDLRKLQGHQSYINAQIIISEQEETMILNKIQELGQIQQNQEELQQLSHSMSLNLGINSANKPKKHHFTAKDKLFFSKISSLLQRFNIFLTAWQNLQRSQQKLKQLMDMYDKQSQRYMSDLIKKFQVQFKNFFRRIVHNGKTDVRQKKISENVKGIVKFKNCLDIKVSFSEDEQFGRWKEFSGGQKTVLALCVIMALQKCEPAPFYVFDQIDSALSQNYVEKIAQIIKEQSESSQYFITSFKKKMLDFGQQTANFYVVQSQNRVSKIIRVDQDQAKRISSQIAQ